jgi:nucleoside-diphosphate-sugar epimerase
LPHIFVAGASRRVGFETVKNLRAKGYAVTCCFRNQADRAIVEQTGARVEIVDAFDAAALAAAIANAGALDAVICTLGGKPGDEPRVDFIGAKHTVDGAKAAGIPRFLFVTAIGCGDTWDVLGEKAQAFLGPAIAAKNQAEAYVFSSGLNYTVLRPGGLSDDPATGSAFLTRNTDVLGTVTRTDVATQLVRCFENDTSKGKVYQVLDRTQMRTESPYVEETL